MKEPYTMRSLAKALYSGGCFSYRPWRQKFLEESPTRAALSRLGSCCESSSHTVNMVHQLGAIRVPHCSSQTGFTDLEKRFSSDREMVLG